MKVKLPLKYLPLEVGDIVEFDKVLGGVNPYGIDYSKDANWSDDDGTYPGHFLNGQVLFPSFMVTSTNKTLEYCEIECMQMHNLKNNIVTTEVSGCMNSNAWNYNNLANVDDGGCLLPPYNDDGSMNNPNDTVLWENTFVVPNQSPFFMHTSLGADFYASNYPENLISSFDMGENLFDTNNNIIND